MIFCLINRIQTFKLLQVCLDINLKIRQVRFKKINYFFYHSINRMSNTQPMKNSSMTYLKWKKTSLLWSEVSMKPKPSLRAAMKPCMTGRVLLPPPLLELPFVRLCCICTDIATSSLVLFTCRWIRMLIG